MQVLSPPEQINFAHNKALLNRYRFIEYETLRILAAWLPAAANMDWNWPWGACFGKMPSMYSTFISVCVKSRRPPSVRPATTRSNT